MDRFLVGRTALMTGSVQGIGLAIGEVLASAGARIAVHGLTDEDQRRSAVEHMLRSGAPEAQFFDADLRDPGAIDRMLDEVPAWRGLDIVVNNAGIQKTVSLADATRELWNDIIAINLSAPFHVMRRALPSMGERGYGRVVNIASVHGLVASVNKSPYVSAKYGLVGLSREAALEYGASGDRERGGITVSCICPGFTETAISEPQILARAAEIGGDRVDGIASILSEKQPSKRLSRAAEIAALALWLTNPLAHNLTGTTIPVDGG